MFSIYEDGKPQTSGIVSLENLPAQLQYQFYNRRVPPARLRLVRRGRDRPSQVYAQCNVVWGTDTRAPFRPDDHKMHVRLVKQMTDGSFRRLARNIPREYEFNLPKSIHGGEHWEALSELVLQTGFLLPPYPEEWVASREVFLDTMRFALEDIVGSENIPPEFGGNNVMVDDTDDIPFPFLDTALRELLPSPDAAAPELTIPELSSPRPDNHAAEDEILRFLYETIPSDDSLTIANALHEPVPNVADEDVIDLYELIDATLS